MALVLNGSGTIQSDDITLSGNANVTGTMTSTGNFTSSGTITSAQGTNYPLSSGATVTASGGEKAIDFTGIPSWVKKITVMM
jgi:phage baseplate assembly protein gpV